MVVAPSFDKEALKILKKKKSLILLKIPKNKKQIIDYRSTLFGELYQTIDLTSINHKFLRLEWYYFEITFELGLQAFAYLHFRMEGNLQLVFTILDYNKRKVYYVGVTRAQKRLHLLSTDHKYNYPIGEDYLNFLRGVK